MGGQALILTSHLLGSNLSKEMQSITGQSRSKKLAQDALFYIRQFVNLHNEPFQMMLLYIIKNICFL